MPEKSFTITVLNINRRQLTLLTSLTSEVSPGDILLLSDNNNQVTATTEVESVARFDRDTLTPSVNGNAQEVKVTLLSGASRLTLTTARVSDTETESAKVASGDDDPLDLSLFDDFDDMGFDNTQEEPAGESSGFTSDLEDEEEAIQLGREEIKPEANAEEFISKPVAESSGEETIAERLSRVSQEMFGTPEETIEDIQETPVTADAHFDSYVGDIVEEEILPSEAVEEIPDELYHNSWDDFPSQSDEPVTEHATEHATEQAEALMPQDDDEDDDSDFFDFDIDINLDQKLSGGPVLSNDVEDWDTSIPSPPEPSVVPTEELPPTSPTDNFTSAQQAKSESTPLPEAPSPKPEIEEKPVDVVKPAQQQTASTGGGYKSGERIFTKEHGEGTIQKVFPFEDSFNLTVQFDNAGKKILNTKYATIKKV